jgi:glutamate dehydrogenase (NAD(P)+)
MSDVFSFADEIGPAKIVHIYEPRLGLKAIVAVDNVACGPAIGGVRLASDVSVEEAFRLARAMTLKNAAAGLAHGGGKSVIFGDPRMPHADKERVIRAFARAIESLTEYIPGPDMGTNEAAMAWIFDEIGRAVGLPPEIGGIPLDRIGATGVGLAAGIEVAVDFCGLDLKGARVVVQGFGAVGQHAARLLAEKGARLIAAADSTGSVYREGGLEVERLIELKRAGGRVGDYPEAETLARDAVIDIGCEIWIPAARPDAITVDNVARLKTRLLAEGANIPATAEAERLLAGRGVLVLPDFIANAGGVICAAAEYHGQSETQALALIVEKVAANTLAVLKRARAEGLLPREVAEAHALEAVRRAMGYRR